MDNKDLKRCKSLIKSFDVARNPDWSAFIGVLENLPKDDVMRELGQSTSSLREMLMFGKGGPRSGTRELMKTAILILMEHKIAGRPVPGLNMPK